MKKMIAFAAALLLSSLSVANEEILTLKGQSPSGADCTYQVMKMNNWEGQVVIYLNSDEGNFRVELNSEAFSKGEIVSEYEADVDLTFVDGVLNVLVSGLEGDADRVIKITTWDGDLLNPKTAEASQAPEEYSCLFNSIHS